MNRIVEDIINELMALAYREGIEIKKIELKKEDFEKLSNNRHFSGSLSTAYGKIEVRNGDSK